MRDDELAQRGLLKGSEALNSASVREMLQKWATPATQITAALSYLGAKATSTLTNRATPLLVTNCGKTSTQKTARKLSTKI